MSGCDLGLDVRDFGLIFEKRKGLTTDPATRPFGEFVGSGIDVKEGSCIFMEENLVHSSLDFLKVLERFTLESKLLACQKYSSILM